MPDPPSPHSIADHFEAALEASCDALIALELLRAELVGAPAAERHATGAIHALRRAIADFRIAHRVRSAALEAGFVVGDSRRQSRPRRTA